MVRRVCREFGNRKKIVVINDEAHHRYRRRVGGEEGEPLKGQERKEAEKREEEAPKLHFRLGGGRPRISSR